MFITPHTPRASGYSPSISLFITLGKIWSKNQCVSIYVSRLLRAGDVLCRMASLVRLYFSTWNPTISYLLSFRGLTPATPSSPACPSSPSSLSCPCRAGASCGHCFGRRRCDCGYGCACGCGCCCYCGCCCGCGCADLCGRGGCGHSRGHSDGCSHRPGRQRAAARPQSVQWARQALAPARDRVRESSVASSKCRHRYGRSSCGHRAPWPHSSQPAALAARARGCGCGYCGCCCCCNCGCCHCGCVCRGLSGGQRCGLGRPHGRSRTEPAGWQVA